MANLNLTDPPTWLLGMNLPGEAISIGVEAFEQAMANGGNPLSSMDESTAKAIAMSAIEKFYQRSGDAWIPRADVEKMIKHEGSKWVLYSKDGSKKLGTFDSKEAAEKREREIQYFKHNKALVEVPLTIRADLQPDGSMRWTAVTSDTDPDRTGEKTSLELFQDWKERVQDRQTVDFLPPPRKPFLGISHYPNLDGYGEAGVTEDMHINGLQFVAEGGFFPYPVGKALFEAINRDSDLIQRGEIENPIRISAAWWDLAHSHILPSGEAYHFERKSLTSTCLACEEGVGNKRYLRGQLDHFAATRVPINPRTSLALQEKSDMTTRKEDATSIIGSELAEELEKRSQLIGKSETEQTPALVVKADKKKVKHEEIEAEEEETEEAPEKKKPMYKKKAAVTKSLSLGGALTLADAIHHAVDGQSRLDLFQAVLDNIDQAIPETEQPQAVKAAVAELNQELFQIKAAVADLWLTEPIQKGVQEMSDNPYQKYADTIQATMTSQASKEQKAATLQQTLNELAQTMKAELEGGAPAVAANDMAAAFKAAVEPLAQQISLLNARLSGQQAGPQQVATYTVPQQKSMVAAPNMAAAVQQPALPVSSVTGQPSEIAAQVRRSVGLQ